MALPISKSQYRLIILILLSVAVVAVMAFLAYLLLTLPTTSDVQATASPRRPVLSLPTAPLPTTTPGPPPSPKAVFTAEKPIKGFSDCNKYGFKGIVKAGNSDRMAGVQVIIWEEGVGLLSMATTDDGGSYIIEINDKPARRKFWVQVYLNDVPASDPVLVETEADCHTGSQFYQINWQAKEE